VLINFRENYISKLIIINISILLLLQQFAYTQVNSNATGQNTNSKTFSKYQLTDSKPFKRGDGILISTFPDTTSFLNNTFPIDDMGFVDFPIVGKVAVSSMSNEELSTFIKEKFQQYIRTPNISIKPMMRISLIGGFMTPGLHYVDYSMSMWDAVRLGGGPSLEMGLKDMVWERDGDEVVDNIIPYFEKGISLKNMGFKSGDQLVTPTALGPTLGESIEFVLGLATFATGLYLTYFTYQLQIRVLQQGR
jgi:protein involved in polysaccharide export with SLBB domain